MDIYDGPNLVGKYENGMCLPAEGTSRSPSRIAPELSARDSRPLPRSVASHQPLTLADFNPFSIFIGCVNPAGSSACQSISDGIGSFSMNIPDGVNQYNIPSGTPITFTVAVNAECVDPGKISVSLETGIGENRSSLSFATEKERSSRPKASMILASAPQGPPGPPAITRPGSTPATKSAANTPAGRSPSLPTGLARSLKGPCNTPGRSKIQAATRSL